MVPATRPKQTREQTETIFAQNLVTANECVILAVRGYYLDSMGKRGRNDQAMYDDALFVLSPTAYKAFNANTDPQKSGANHAMLKAPQKIQYYKGKHKGKYDALRPYPEAIRLPCTRDGVESMCSHTNIHKGGYRDTHSEGCITVWPAQFSEFIKLVYSEMSKYNQKTITVLLIENTGA